MWAMHVLETERLRFRPLTLDDVDDLAALYADPEVMFHFDGTRTREQARAEIERIQGQYATYGFHFWATTLRADGRFIGRCGLIPMTVEDRPEHEVAYVLARAHWGRGLGTEAARAIKEWAFREHGFPRVISLIDPRNIASQRVALKNGMRYVKDVEYNGYIDRMYAVDNS